MPWEGHVRRDEIRHRLFILPPNMQETPTLALDKYNMDLPGSWEFNRDVERVT
jgi:hypothetical protein